MRQPRDHCLSKQTVHTDGYFPTMLRDNAFFPESICQSMVNNDVNTFCLSSMRSEAALAHSRFTFESEMTSLPAGFKSEIRSGLFEGFNLDGYVRSPLNNCLTNGWFR